MENTIISFDVNEGSINFNVNYNVKLGYFYENVKNSIFMKFLKGVYRSNEKFEKNFIQKLILPYEKTKDEDFNALKDIENFKRDFDTAVPISYREAHEIKNRELRSIVFGSIDVSSMIMEMGHERIKVEGKQVNHKKFDNDGNFIGYHEYDVIYETHKVNGKSIGIDGYVYAIKCWCTTTNEEHWLWIDEKYKDSPLEAIASTCMVHKKILPYIKEIKRQGDVFIVELIDDSIVVDESDEMVPLTAEQYFKLLTAQS